MTKRKRQATVERVPERHRIRHIAAAKALERPKAPSTLVAAGTVSATTRHLEGVARRLALVIRKISEANSKIDRLTE